MAWAGQRARRRWARFLMAAAGVVLIGGIVPVSLAIWEHSQHPEWSAPAYVNVIYIVPYVVVAGVLAGIARWLGRRSGTDDVRLDPTA